MIDSTAEILVVGGGPVGLLTASCLGKRHQVVLIEKNNVGSTSKFWVTTERRLRKNNLLDCVLSRHSRMFAGTFLGGCVRVDGDFTVVDEDRLLTIIADRCIERGVRINCSCSLLNVQWTPDRIIANTNRGSLFPRLIVDASGAGSVLSSSFGLHKNRGYYSVYGAHLTNVDLISDDIVLAYIDTLGHPPVILEIIPISERSVYFVVFTYSERLLNPVSLSQAFSQSCKANPFFKITKSTTRKKEISGIIPIGKRIRKRLRGIVPLGEAGFAQPPLMGTAFNEALEYTDEISASISKALESNDHCPPTPNTLYPIKKVAHDTLQSIIVSYLLSRRLEAFDTALRAAGCLSSNTAFNFFSSEMSWIELFQTATLLPTKMILHHKRRHWIP